MVLRSTNEAKWMSESGTATFTNSDDYQAAIGGASVKAIVSGGGDFKARLTRLNLSHLQLLRGGENLPSIAYTSLSPARIFVSFPTTAAPLIWDGVELGLGDIVFHSRGERAHQRTTGESQWGLVSLPPEQLAFYSNALIGRKITSPRVGRVLRPSSTASRRLLRLHSKACRLVETRYKLIANPEVARAVEQQLLHALINCLTVDRAKGQSWKEANSSHANIMVRFEDALTSNPGPLVMPKLCAALGVPERTMRTCCAEFLGMSPTRYALLKRLAMVRSALRCANPATTTVAVIARRYQFSEPGRFAVTYRTIFGETPSTTLRRARLS